MRTLHETHGVSLEQRGTMCTAAEFGQLDILQYFVSQGVSVDSRGLRGRTALIDASAAGHLVCVVFLLGKGANARIRTGSGVTALVS